MQYIKKPIKIEAHKLEIENKDKILEWSTIENPIVIVTKDVQVNNFYGVKTEIKYAEIKTLEGIMKANKGDWIIKGIKGEVYPCKSDIFEMTYELVSLG